MARSLAREIGGTTRQRATRELRDRIFTGEFSPGQRLDLDDITEEFGISRTPVREALLELSFQGLVEVAPRSGVTVIGITPAETLDNFAILAALTGKAAEWAAARITPTAMDELTRCGRVLSETPPGPALVAANWEFHRIINEAAGSTQLLSLIRQAVRLIPSNFLAVIPVQETDQDEHEQLVRLIKRRQATRVRVLAERHVLAAGESLSRWLADRSS